MKDIDISKYASRSDLADEIVELDTQNKECSVFNTRYGELKVSYIKIFDDNNSFNKKKGDYVSIEFASLEDKKIKNDVKELLRNNLKEMISKYNLSSEAKILIVGLGNENFISDSLGPMSAKKIIVTSHLFEFDKENIKEGTRCVALLVPGVMGQTGLESADIVKSICDFYNPELIIFIDSLASKSISRVNKVIQLCDSGIEPGSGIGNNRKAMNQEFLNCPTIAIGVATVVSLTSVVNETIEMIEKKYNKLPFLSEENKYNFVSSILEEKGLNMIVTPKEIDEDIENIAYVIGNAINEAIHQDRNNL